MRLALVLWGLLLVGCQPSVPDANSAGQTSSSAAPVREIAKTPTWSAASADNSPATAAASSNRSLNALELLRTKIAMELRVIDQVCQAHSQRTDLHEKIKQFLRNAIDLSHQLGTRTAWRDLQSQGSQLQQELGDDPDPVIEHYIATACFYQSDMGAAAASSQKAIRLFRKFHYPSFLVISSYRIFSQSFLSSPDIGIRTGDASRNPLLPDYLSAIRHWLQKDLSEKGDEHRLVYHLFTKVVRDLPKDTDETLSELQQFIAEECQLPPWLHEMLIGHMYMSRAWAARGHGYADTVTNQGWQGFREFGSKSGAHFRQALKLNPYFPESAFELISVAMVGFDQESPRYWFDQSQKIQFDFTPAYTALVNALHPKWGGDFAAILDFANECWETQRFDTFIPYYYVHFLRDLKRDNPEYILQAADPVAFAAEVHQRHFQIFKRLAESAAPIAEVDQISPVTYFQAGMLFYADGNMNATEVLAACEKIDLEMFAMTCRNIGNYRNPATALATIRAKFGPHQEAFRPIVETISQNKQMSLEQTRTLLNRIDDFKQLELSTDDRVFLDAVGSVLAVEKSFAEGQRTPLTFDKNFSLWASRDFDQVQFDTTNSVIVDTNSGNPVFHLMAYPRLAGPRIVEFELEALGNLEDTPRGHTFGACPVVLATGHPLYLGSNVKTGNLGLSNRMVVRPMSIRYLSRNSSRKFRALINDDYIELYVNNMFLLRAELKLAHDRPMLEFTQPGFDITRGQYRISNIHVTRWNQTAPPFDEGPEALVAYYSTYLQEFPKDAWGHLWRGMARLKLNQLAEAEQDIVKALELGCPVCYAGFFLGDCLDRQGKTALAIDWYQKCLDPKGREVAYFAEGIDDAKVTEPLMWAASRLDYLSELLPDRELAKKAVIPDNWKDTSFFWITPVSCPGNWIVGLNRAIRRSDTRVVDNTVAAFKKEQFDFKDEVQFEEMIKAVSQYQEYRDPPGAQPQYLKLDLSPWYFRLANEVMSPQLLERLYSW